MRALPREALDRTPLRGFALASLDTRGTSGLRALAGLFVEEPGSIPVALEPFSVTGALF